MKFSTFTPAETDEVIALFIRTFSVSENEAEGKLIGKLVAELIKTTPPQELIGCLAKLNNDIVGGLFFSRFVVPGNGRAFLLSPVAVSPHVQGTGIGQQLINYGLTQLQSLHANLVFTYGDPAFYCKTGFRQISEQVVKAPYALSQPEGWLAQSLDGSPIQVTHEATECVEAFRDQRYW